MKLSAVVLIGVNLAAGLQAAALAADTEVGESAAFLQESLSGVPKAKPLQAKKHTARKLAMSADVSLQRRSHARSARTMTSLDPLYDNKVSIRPFVPGRYLPSEADLRAQRDATLAAKESAYQTMAAQADFSNSLSGRVSDFSMAQPTSSAKPVQNEYMRRVAQIAVSKVKSIAVSNFTKPSPRTLPGVTPVMPGQIAEMTSNPGIIPSMPEPGTQAAQPVHVARSIASVMPPVPMLSPYEQAQLNRQVNANMPEVCYSQSSNGEMRAQGQGNPGLAGVGPPPFPLSMAGGGQLHQAMRTGSSHLPVTAQARFGSWHGGSEGLSSASFHSYLSAPMNGPLSVTRVPRGAVSARTGKQAHSYSHKHINRVPLQIARRPAQLKAQPYVATYSSYRRYSG